MATAGAHSTLGASVIGPKATFDHSKFGPGMEDSRLWKEIISKLRDPFPGRLILQTVTPERTQPEAFYLGPEFQQGAEVCWHCVVRKEAGDNLLQPITLPPTSRPGGRADAPAIAVVPPVAVRAHPARWVAARPDHGAAPPRARAGGVASENRHRRMTESDPWWTSTARLANRCAAWRGVSDGLLPKTGRPAPGL